MDPVFACVAPAEATCASWVQITMPVVDTSTWGMSFGGGFSVVFGCFILGVILGHGLKMIGLVAH